MFPSEKVVDEAIKLGEKIGTHSKLIVAMCKESVNNCKLLCICWNFQMNSFNLAYETTLSQGLKTEKRLFHATFATVRHLLKY